MSTTTTIAPVKGKPKITKKQKSPTACADDAKRAKLLAEIVNIGDLLSRLVRLEDDLYSAGMSAASPFCHEFDAVSNELRSAVIAYVRALGRG